MTAATHTRTEETMTFSRSFIVILPLLATMACRQDATTIVRPQLERSDIPQAASSSAWRTRRVKLVHKPSAPVDDERRLVDRIVALHPSAAAVPLRAVLSNRFSQLTLSGNSEEEELIRALRAVRARTEVAAPEPVEATVVLLDRLSDPSALAVVVRRPTTTPHDLILLADGYATGTALRAGVAALFKMRMVMGDIPMEHMHVVVRGARAAGATNTNAVESRTESDLAALQRSARRPITGVGSVRAIEIPLKSMGRRNHASLLSR